MSFAVFQKKHKACCKKYKPYIFKIQGTYFKISALYFSSFKSLINNNLQKAHKFDYLSGF